MSNIMISSSDKTGNQNASEEVVNGFRSCKDLSDAVPFYNSRGIYLKPIAKIHVSVNLPQLKSPGKTISTWEVMEKIRLLIRPDEFSSLKVSKSTLEFMRFEGDLGDRSRLQRVLARLNGQRFNLAGFSNVLKIKATELKDDFPSRHSWDSYFRDAKHMNELKAGERPDTIHISGLPIKWFSEDGKNPSESLIAKIFKRWGDVRRVDIPVSDPYRSRMRFGPNIQTFSYDDGIFFDAFIQYIEYMDFVKAMDALRGMKLLKKEKEYNHLVAAIKVDFDKTKHMSDSSVSRREFERKRLIAQDNLAAEKRRKKEEAEAKKKEEIKKVEEEEMKKKVSRRRLREEKRKRKALTVYRKQEEDKVSMKIAREERKLIKAQRQLESIRLLDTLFDRITTKLEKKEIDVDIFTASFNNNKNNEEKMKDQFKEKELKKKKSKRKEKKQKKTKKKKTSSVELNSVDEHKPKINSIIGTNKNDKETVPCSNVYPVTNWYYNNPMPIIYPSVRNFSRGGRRVNRGGRGKNKRLDVYRPHYEPHHLGEQYYKYFASLVGQDYRDFLPKSEFEDDSQMRNSYRRQTCSRSRSRNRSVSTSRDNRRSRIDKVLKSKEKRKISESRSNRVKRSRSSKRSQTRSQSPSKSSSRKNRSRLKKRQRSNCSSRTSFRRSESKVCITRAKSRTPLNRRHTRSSSWSLPRSTERRSRSCSWSENIDNKRKNHENLSKTKNIDQMKKKKQGNGNKEKEKSDGVSNERTGENELEKNVSKINYKNETDNYKNETIEDDEHSYTPK